MCLESKDHVDGIDIHLCFDWLFVYIVIRQKTKVLKGSGDDEEMSFPTVLVHFYIEKSKKYYCFISVAWNGLEPSTTWSSPRYEYCLDPSNISMTYCLGNNQIHDVEP